jgi:hypothetical protein
VEAGRVLVQLAARLQQNSAEKLIEVVQSEAKKENLGDLALVTYEVLEKVM